MEQAIRAYNEIKVTPEFLDAAWRRDDALSNEKTALDNAEAKGRIEERNLWEGVVAEKDAAIERLQAQLAELQTEGN